MLINNELQLSMLEKIPFMGSGEILVKKEVSVGSKVIVKEVSGLEHEVEVITFSSGVYTGVTTLGLEIKFRKEHVFLILSNAS